MNETITIILNGVISFTVSLLTSGIVYYFTALQEKKKQQKREVLDFYYFLQIWERNPNIYRLEEIEEKFLTACPLFLNIKVLSKHFDSLCNEVLGFTARAKQAKGLKYNFSGNTFMKFMQVLEDYSKAKKYIHKVY